MKRLDNGLFLHFFKAHDVTNKSEVAYTCVELTKAANFPTDYDDVYSHLFDSPKNDIIFVTLSEVFKENEIVGFAVICMLDILKSNVMYLSGIVLHPDVQQKKIPKAICQEALSMHKPDYVTARTHNPRAFKSVASLAGEKDIVYPILDFRWQPIPQDILRLVANHPFLKDCNDHLIIENAYPDAKPQQEISSPEIQNIFTCLRDNDAQAIVIKFAK